MKAFVNELNDSQYKRELGCHSRGGGNPERKQRNWIPAFAGMTIKYNKQKNRGFTLIEIIILIVMAGILLPVIIVPFVTGVKGSQKPEMATTAMYLAHQKMEELMKFRYLDPALNPTALTTPVAAPIAGYQWQWEILYVGDDTDFTIVGDGIAPANHRGYKRIRVRVIDPLNDTYEISSVVAFFH